VFAGKLQLFALPTFLTHDAASTYSLLSQSVNIILRASDKITIATLAQDLIFFFNYFVVLPVMVNKDFHFKSELRRNSGVMQTEKHTKLP